MILIKKPRIYGVRVFWKPKKDAMKVINCKKTHRPSWYSKRIKHTYIKSCHICEEEIEKFDDCLLYRLMQRCTKQS